MASEELPARLALWFGQGLERQQRRAQDAHLAARFGTSIEQAARGELAQWADSPRRRLSLILLLDQFPRSVYRGTRRAFAADEQALGLALSGIQSGGDAALDVVERIFFYMPLQHAESLDAQLESQMVYQRLFEEGPAPLRPLFVAALEAAREHHALIARFGRFPHRNRALGRASTEEERAYLTSTGEQFGQ
jgi:uncharacterized protein (DUF924 family)